MGFGCSQNAGVLIELGFLSNKEEGEYLNSDEGQTEMARQIANAIIHYKKMYFNEPLTEEDISAIDKKFKEDQKEIADTAMAKPEETVKVEPGQALYKIQLFASSKKKDLYSNDFKGLKDISFTFENNLYRYYYGKSYDLASADRDGCG